MILNCNLVLAGIWTRVLDQFSVKATLCTYGVSPLYISNNILTSDNPYIMQEFRKSEPLFSITGSLSSCLLFSFIRFYHYCPDVASLMVVNIVQNKELYPKQVLFDLNSDSLYNPLLKRGSNEFWPNGILANNGLFALVAGMSQS